MYLCDMKKLNNTTLKACKATIGIYKLIIGEHYYIGSSCNIANRLKNHVWHLKNNKHHNSVMQKLYNNLKIKDLYFEIIELCNENKLIEREVFYVENLKPFINSSHPFTLKRSEESKKRMSEAKRKQYLNGFKPHNIKTVYKYTLQGIFIKSYESITEAAKDVNLKNVNSIIAVCENKTTSAGGFSWSYNKKENINVRSKEYKLTKVNQYSLDNVFIKEWKSIKEAETSLKITNIARAIKKDLTAGKYRWKIV